MTEMPIDIVHEDGSSFLVRDGRRYQITGFKITHYAANGEEPPWVEARLDLSYTE